MEIFWLIMFVISLVLCYILIERVWYKWWNSPVIVSFNERMIPVGEVPFPSVTICPQMKNKLSKHEYQNQYYKYRYHSRLSRKTGRSYASIKDDLKLLDDAMLVCRNNDDYPYHIINHNLTDESSVYNINKIAPTIRDTFFTEIEWREQFIWNEKLFNKVITSEGICFTFNTLKQTDMFKNESIQNKYFYLYPTPDQPQEEDGWFYKYYDNDNTTVYPRQGQESSAYPDLPVILVQNVSDNDGLCNSIYRGYKIYLHHPDDMPQSSLHYYPLLPGQVTSLALKFSAMSTSESLMKYAPELRQCYSSKDRKLRYFKKYTPSNCRLECSSIYTYKRCGCVWFHMPHSNSSEICTAMMRQCVEMAQHELALNKSKVDMEDVCNCLPSCDSIQYDADVFRTTFEYKKYMVAYFGDHIFSNKSIISYSKLEVYFKEPQFMAMRRSELFGLTEFLANCGGLLGLFLGFSFLSIVEIFYFCTLRLWYALKRNDKVSIKNGKKTNKLGKGPKDKPDKKIC